ncbi:hypothetical protein [Caulobacter segnis]
MNKTITVAVLIAACATSGCATKRYPIAAQMGAAERSTMTCRELDLELIRAEEVRKQISTTAKTDWRSVAGFLGDYGIGNAMAKSDAEKAINNRVTAINDAKAEKKCGAAQTSWIEGTKEWFGQTFFGE